MRAWSFVIDETDRIVQVGDEMPGGMEPFLGHPLWEYLPHGQPVFGPLFEEARATGHEVETIVYYAGGTVGVRVVPSGKKSSSSTPPGGSSSTSGLLARFLRAFG